LIWPCWDQSPRSLHVGGVDFWQYYTGGLVAHYRLWKDLYPTPNKEVYDKVPDFKPQIPTGFFDSRLQEARQGKWAFYPPVGYPYSSTVKPELFNLCPQLRHTWHYIYPPPTALLLWPLGFFDHETASHIWFAIICGSFFGTGCLASRIFRVLIGKPTYAEGWIMLLPIIPTLLGSGMTAVETGNVSPLLGFLITTVVYSWISNQQIIAGIGIIPLVLFKGIGLGWCPLFIIKPIKWKTIVTLALLTLFINAVAFYYGGTDSYRTYFIEILPRSSIPLGYGLQGRLLHFLGIELKIDFFIANILLSIVIYWAYWVRRDSVNFNRNKSVTIAAIAGILAIFCICNPVIWPTYYTNYLLLPFAGWVLWEGFQAKMASRAWIFTIFSLSALSWLDSATRSTMMPC